MQTLSVRTYLLLLFLATAVPVFGLLGLGIYLDMQNTVEQTKTSLRTLAATMIRNTGGSLSKAQQSLERLAERPLVQLMDEQQCDPALAGLLSMNPAYANVVYANIEGRVLCSAYPLPGGKAVSVQDIPWFQDFLREPRPMIGLPHKGLITGKWVSVVASPVRNARQELVGAVYLPLDLSSFNPNVPDQWLPAESRYGFIARDGTLIWRNLDPEGVIGSKPNSEAARRIAEISSGEFESLAVDGVRRYFSVQVMPETGWVAFVGVPATVVYAESRRRAVLALVVASAALLTLTLMAVLIARRITRPIARLEGITRQIHSGEFGARLVPEGPRELREVAEAFNAMAARMELSTRQLEAEIRERKDMEDQIRLLAVLDPLTQLPNRRLLIDRLGQAISMSKRSTCHSALMFVDLDQFKPLNDRHGHVAGDQLLVEAAGRLRRNVREQDTVARFGGDEFVVLTVELSGEAEVARSQAAVIAEKVRQALAEPYVLRRQSDGCAVNLELEPGVEGLAESFSYPCTASIGVVVFRAGEVDPAEILKQADQAMYQAKHSGHNRVCFYGAVA